MDTKLKQRKWEDHIDSQIKSGLSQSAYCKREGLKLSTFLYHRSKIKQGTHQGTNSRFIELSNAIGFISDPENDKIFFLQLQIIGWFNLEIRLGDFLPKDTRVFLRPGSTDMRKSIYTLGYLSYVGNGIGVNGACYISFLQ